RSSAVQSDALHEIRGIPFVYEHQIGAREHSVQIKIAIRRACQVRVGALERFERRAAVFRREMVQAPTARGLEHAHLVARSYQLGRDASKEVGVAVIPIGNERVAEDYDPHGAPAWFFDITCAYSSM